MENCVLPVNFAAGFHDFPPTDSAFADVTMFVPASNQIKD